MAEASIKAYVRTSKSCTRSPSEMIDRKNEWA
jgi:hypothetical protein